MCPVFEEKCLSRRAEHSFTKCIQRRSNFGDNLCVRPVEIKTEETVWWLEEMVLEDRLG